MTLFIMLIMFFVPFTITFVILFLVVRRMNERESIRRLTALYKRNQMDSDPWKGE